MLTLNNINLRALEPEDIDLLYKWENNTELWVISETIVPFSKYLLTKFLENSSFDIYQTRELKLIIEYKDIDIIKPVGLIDVFDFDPYHNRAGIGIMIHDQSERKKNLAFDALTVFINYAQNVLQLHQIYCNIMEDNIPSIRLFEKAGFSSMGCKKHWRKVKNGWKDEFSYQLILNQ